MISFGERCYSNQYDEISYDEISDDEISASQNNIWENVAKQLMSRIYIILKGSSLRSKNEMFLIFRIILKGSSLRSKNEMVLIFRKEFHIRYFILRIDLIIS